MRACAVAAATALYASRLTDADQLGNRVHRRCRLERRHLTVAAIAALLRLAMLIVALLVRHRGATHWLLTGAALTAALTAAAATLSPALAVPVMAGAGLGYATHLLADACTPHGAPLLGPFSRRCVHLLPRGRAIRTGGGAEIVLLALAGSAAVASAAIVIS